MVTKCNRPCTESYCYVCEVEKNGRIDNYMWHDDPFLDGIYVNQNLSGIQELVVVPREHVGEFRLMSHNGIENFFRQLRIVVLRLLNAGAQGIEMHINYGDWIVHRAGCPHYHAHLHLTWTNFTQTMAYFSERGSLRCPIATKTRLRYDGDVIEPLEAPFRASLFLSAGRLIASFLHAQAERLATITGFSLRVDVPERLDNGGFNFSIRRASAGA